MKYYFHILGQNRLKIDAAGQVFSNRVDAAEHGQFIAKDLKNAGLKDVLIIVTSDNGEILCRIDVKS